MIHRTLCYLSVAALMCNAALGGVWVVCDDDGSNPVVTKAHVLSVFAKANTVLWQAGVDANIIEDGIQYINRSAWKHLNRADSTFQQTLRDMRALPKGGALRIFFVDTCNGSDLVGFNTDFCMVVAKNASGVALAHEICHAGGLRDIYATQDSLSITDAGVVKAEYLDPNDWGGGYYPPDLLHTTFITRLLMYGYVSPDAICIPRGRVYGVYKPKINGKIQPVTKGMVPVGQQDLNRQPEHFD